MVNDQHPESGPSWRFHALAVFSICAAGAIAYSNTLQVPFVCDDTPNIVENHRTRVTSLELGELYEASLDNISPRPIAHLSFALNYYFGGYEVAGYHLVNIAIHLLNGILVYCLAIRTYQLFFRTCGSSLATSGDKAAGLMACFAAGVFVLHPVQVQAVTYLVQRMASMAAMFYLLSLLTYIQGRLCEQRRLRLAWWTGSLVAGLMALGTKQIAVTLPVAIVIYEWYFFQDLNLKWAKRRLKVLIGLLAAIFFVSLLFLGDSPWQHIVEGYTRRDFSLGERVFTQFRVVVFYVSLVLLPLPSRLNLLHGISTSHGLFDPVTTLLSLFCLLGLAGLGVYWARRERLLSFAVVWFFLTLAIESSVIALEMIFEHRLYLPMFGFALVVPYLILRVSASRVILGRAIAVLLLLSLGVGTYVRNTDWIDQYTLWNDVAQKNPLATRAFLARADALSDLGKNDQALTDYAKAEQLDPDYPDTYLNRGKHYLRLGQHSKALPDISQAIKLAPDFQRAYMSRGDMYANQGKLDLAVADYTQAIQYSPDYAAPYNNRAIVLGRQGLKDQALADFALAIDLNPAYAQAYFNRASFYRNLKKYELAIEDYTKSITLDPENAEAHLGRGSVHETLGQDPQAITDYTQAIALGADQIPANKRLAWLLAASADEQNRNGKKALHHAKRACELSIWQAPECLEALAAAYAEQGEFNAAIKWQTKAIQLAEPRVLPETPQRLELYRQAKPYRMKAGTD